MEAGPCGANRLGAVKGRSVPPCSRAETAGRAPGFLFGRLPPHRKGKGKNPRRNGENEGTILWLVPCEPWKDRNLPGPKTHLARFHRRRRSFGLPVRGGWPKFLSLDRHCS